MEVATRKNSVEGNKKKERGTRKGINEGGDVKKNATELSTKGNSRMIKKNVVEAVKQPEKRRRKSQQGRKKTGKGKGPGERATQKRAR